MATQDSLLVPARGPWSAPANPRRREALRKIARSIAGADPALAVFSPYVSGLHGAMLDAPSLVVEDHGSIRLFEHSGDAAYSYRALLLAGDDDLVAIGVERSGGFENYCRDWLGLGAPELLVPRAGGPDDTLATRCSQDPDFIARVGAHARAHGGINILPYMASWPLWKLAARIAGKSRVPVRVVGPPPQLVRRTNDKIWFAYVARKVCGADAIAPSLTAHNAARLCQLTQDLAAGHRSVAIKLPDSASSAGNLVLDAAELEGLSLQALHDRLDRRLRRMGWAGNFPLQVVAWKQAVVSSPSAQLWIPAAEAGAPVVEAIFEQHTHGLAREFDGARPSRLDPDTQQRVATQAFDMACVLQDLGYIGRCSLDAILVGDAPGQPRLYWVECNGRWGGVSLPLSLNRRLDRLSAQPMPFVIFEQAHQQAAPRTLKTVLASLDAILYRHGRRNRGVVLLSPGRLLDGSGYEFLVRDPYLEGALQIGQEIARHFGAAAD